MKLSPACKSLQDAHMAISIWFLYSEETRLFRSKIKNVTDQYPVEMPRVVSNISLDVFEYARTR